MKNNLLFFLLIAIPLMSFSQSIFGEKKYLYGRMVGQADTLVGYFWFDNQIDQNGQTVFFKKDLNSNKKKKFQSRNYLYFESDSIYLETFPAIPTVTGAVLIMIPRIVNGRIQLFDSKYKWGYANMFKIERFFIKVGGDKVQVKRKNFKQLMNTYLADDEDLITKIENEELQYDNLMEIIITYNNRHQAE
jgi:hypothetical protein